MAAGDGQTPADRMSAIGKQHVQRSVGTHRYLNLTQLHCDLIAEYKGKVVSVLH
jgi:hypothetical protein